MCKMLWHAANISQKPSSIKPETRITKQLSVCNTITPQKRVIETKRAAKEKHSSLQAIWLKPLKLRYTFCWKLMICFTKTLHKSSIHQKAHLNSLFIPHQKDANAAQIINDYDNFKSLMKIPSLLCLHHVASGACAQVTLLISVLVKFASCVLWLVRAYDPIHWRNIAYFGINYVQLRGMFK